MEVGVESPPISTFDAGDYGETANRLGFGSGTDEEVPEEAKSSYTDGVEPEEGAETDEEGELEADLVELKVNGKRIEKPMSEVVALAQKQIAGEAKLEQAKAEIEEARKVRQQADTQISAVKQLLQVVQRGDLDTIAEFARERLGAGDAFDRSVIQYALKLYEMSKMSPEQREALENKRMIEKYRMEAQERQRLDQERAMEYQVNKWSEHIATELPKAIQQSGLPDTAFVREHIISAWRTALEQGKNPTPMAVAQYVRQRLEESGMLNSGPKHPTMPTKPRATRESVGLRREAGQQDTQYQSWDAWIKNRGR